jgi:DNA-binding NarL/FixJ family response regulator
MSCLAPSRLTPDQDNSSIASELVVGDATIKTHVARIFSKLGFHHRAQAVVLAYESGLVQPGGD